MPPSETFILVVHARSARLDGEALVKAIRSRARDLHLTVQAPYDPEAIRKALTETGAPRAFLLIAGPADIDAQIRALAEAHPGVCLVAVEPRADRIRLEVPQLGLDGLVSLLRSMPATSLGGKGMAERIAHVAIALAEGNQENQADTRDGIITDWLDATLRLHIARSRVADDEKLPGLTLSAATADRLLAQRRGRSAEIAPDLLLDMHAQAEARLTKSLDAEEEEVTRLTRLARRIRLDSIEVKALLLCLAPELDPTYQRVYGLLNDDLSRRSATLGLVASVLGEPATMRHRLATLGGLARWRLVEPHHDAALAADHTLRVDAAIAAWLIEDRPLAAADPRFSGWLHAGSWGGSELVDGWPETERLAGLLGDAAPGFIVLGGSTPAADEWCAIAEAAAQRQDRELLRVVPPSSTPSGSADPSEAAARIARAARLLDLVPAIVPDGHGADPGTAIALLEGLARQPGFAESGPVLLLADPGPFAAALAPGRYIVLARAPTAMPARVDMLRNAASRHGVGLAKAGAERLAAVFPLASAAISNAAELATALAAAEDANTRAEEPHLARALRSIAMPRLPQFARPIEPAFSLKQIKLPEEQSAQLREIVEQCRHAGTVLDRWGFGAQLPYGRGVAALFSGPSGTGKTMAAQAIARALGTELFQVDLARVVSKYIGETEKNLDVVFDEAERAGVVLLCDEADALFGKRGEVRDAHDRYANLETAYLLQRLEAFAGLAVLTSNLRQNIDSAFLRRLRFVVEFPRPDAAAREYIWHQCLHGAPRSDDVNELAIRVLARRLELTGGEHPTDHAAGSLRRRGRRQGRQGCDHAGPSRRGGASGTRETRHAGR
ncbi:ATP-binding protein [Siccirubricoccus sp. G192]|uniref:ATP-binding protein n=1 Tax=Siccirubricoccus sp. G192 TaxID=2849651 RepID=UPI001C2C7B9C|nr:ATP-binding protein [Siccirubricoccus sp. G192]MBV1800611.1 ATP-binding protein [Siccirubricoccus sp. G192]